MRLNVVERERKKLFQGEGKQRKGFVHLDLKIRNAKTQFCYINNYFKFYIHDYF